MDFENLDTVDKHFVSKIDKFLTNFDKTQSKSLSQRAEIQKHACIFRLRDNISAAEDRVIWEDF